MATSNDVAIGYDEGLWSRAYYVGTISIKLGHDEPSISMDQSGKIVWANHNEIQTANIQQLEGVDALQDGEKLQLAVKDLGI